MKTIIYLLLGLCLFSCQQKKVRDFIPGVYVNHSSGEYSTADDTLVVSPVGSGSYRIVRKTGYNRISDGRAGKREYGTETWNGVYDEKAGVINEQRYGKVISFVPDSGLLQVGRRTYRKMK